LRLWRTEPKNRDPDETADQERTQRKTILKCPQCCSHRAIILNTTPLRARCADCNRTYSIKTIDPQYDVVPQTKQRPGGHKKTKPDYIPVVPPSPRELGVITEFIDDAIKGGPEGFRSAQREANRLARKFGLSFDPEWFLCTKWLKEWGKRFTRNTSKRPTVDQRNGAAGGEAGTHACALRLHGVPIGFVFMR